MNDTQLTPRRTLFWSALATSVLALVAFGVAATTPPRTGPYAAAGSALAYPYADAGRFVPRDFIWMYPALLMILAYLVLSASLHDRAVSAGARTWGTLALALAIASFAVLALDYFVQIHAVQPALLGREAADIATLSQYNPHGFFIALENLGYLTMALSLGAFALTLGRTRLERAARWVFGGAAVLAALSLAIMSLVFGIGLEYRFEVAIIAIDYFALLIGGGLVAAFALRGEAGTERRAAL